MKGNLLLLPTRETSEPITYVFYELIFGHSEKSTILKKGNRLNTNKHNEMEDPCRTPCVFGCDKTVSFIPRQKMSWWERGPRRSRVGRCPK